MDTKSVVDDVKQIAKTLPEFDNSLKTLFTKPSIGNLAIAALWGLAYFDSVEKIVVDLRTTAPALKSDVHRHATVFINNQNPNVKPIGPRRPFV